MDDIRYRMDRKHVNLLLLFDFSKAFDTVCHVTLLQKLKKLGFANSAQWIASYLSDRAQAVIDDHGERSSFAPLNRGVPQGSVLGLLLFALYASNITYRFKSCVFISLHRP